MQAGNSVVTEMVVVHPFHITGNMTCTDTGQRYASLLQPAVLQAELCDTTTVIIHDGAPLHIARCVKQLLRRHFGDNRIFSRKFLTTWPSNPLPPT